MAGGEGTKNNIGWLISIAEMYGRVELKQCKDDLGILLWKALVYKQPDEEKYWSGESEDLHEALIVAIERIDVKEALSSKRA